MRQPIYEHNKLRIKVIAAYTKQLIICAFLLFSTPLLAYDLVFEGNLPKEVLDLMQEASLLKLDHNVEPPTFFALKQRAEADQMLFLEILDAFGYYEGEVLVSYAGTFPNTVIKMTCYPNQLYLFSNLQIFSQEGVKWFLNEKNWSVQPNHPAQFEQVLNTEKQILEQMICDGYPFAKINKRTVSVDQKSKTVSVSYIVESGPTAYFGPMHIKGLHKVRPSYIQRQLTWKEGDLYNPDKLNLTTKLLKDSSLFSFVSLKHAEELNENGMLPIDLLVEEKFYRHIGLGIDYDTDKQFGGAFEWGHDNLSGWGDSVLINAECSRQINQMRAFYAIPDSFSDNHKVLYSIEARRKKNVGFTEKLLSFLVRSEYRHNEWFSYYYGGQYEYLVNTQSDRNNNYNLLSVPSQLRFDTSNNFLNPTSGSVIAYFFTPYQAIFNSQISFIQQELFITTYQPLVISKKILFAASLHIGSILGQPFPQIPTSKRFYAGSSTDLRGYKYLSVSPLNTKNQPIGGLSLITLSGEPRLQIMEKLFLAFFYDIGNVYERALPPLNKKMLRSIGCGLRYLTPLGPLRLDIGFPLDKRKDIDKTFEIYATLGQTF